MKILVIDIGGTNVKLLASGHSTPRKFASGRKLTPKAMVEGVLAHTKDWPFDVVSIGYPGIVVRNRPIVEPHNIGKGWVDFDYAAAFGRPVKIINDAAMQALGSYKGGKLLFLGLGTGLGSAMVVDGVVEPMELGHAAYRRSNFEHYLGVAALERMGRKKWRAEVDQVVAALIRALEPDDTVLGGGNVKKLTKLPPGCRAGSNANAFVGGMRMWDEARPRGTKPSRKKKSRA